MLLLLQIILCCLLYLALVKCAVRDSGRNCLYFYPDAYLDEAQRRGIADKTEELRKGKTLDTALQSGYHRAFSAIFDGNLPGIIVAIVLMGAFGVPSSIWANLFNKIFFFFGATTEGVIYSFGFTLMTGLIMNFIMGVLAARLLTMSLSGFKCFQNKKLYGGDIHVKAD